MADIATRGLVHTMRGFFIIYGCFRKIQWSCEISGKHSGVTGFSGKYSGVMGFQESTVK